MGGAQRTVLTQENRKILRNEILGFERTPLFRRATLASLKKEQAAVSGGLPAQHELSLPKQSDMVGTPLRGVRASPFVDDERTSRRDVPTRIANQFFTPPSAACIALKNTSVLSITPVNSEAPMPYADTGMSDAVCTADVPGT